MKRRLLTGLLASAALLGALGYWYITTHSPEPTLDELMAAEQLPLSPYGQEAADSSALVYLKPVITEGECDGVN